MSKIDSHRCALQEEQAEKVRLVEVYNARLTGRERRRAFIRDRGLLNVKRMQVGASPFVGFLCAELWCGRLVAQTAIQALVVAGSLQS